MIADDDDKYLTLGDLADRLEDIQPGFRQEVAAAQILGSQVRNARDAAGMSQRKLAEIAGVRQATIAEIEIGAVDPRFSTLVKIGRALGISTFDVPAA